MLRDDVIALVANPFPGIQAQAAAAFVKLAV